MRPLGCLESIGMSGVNFRLRSIVAYIVFITFSSVPGRLSASTAEWPSSSAERRSPVPVYLYDIIVKRMATLVTNRETRSSSFLRNSYLPGNSGHSILHRLVAPSSFLREAKIDIVSFALLGNRTLVMTTSFGPMS